jgi:hypothetical protein
MATAPRISRIENVPGVLNRTIDCGPFGAAADIIPVSNVVKQMGFAHRDLFIDDVLSHVRINGGAGAKCTLVYAPISDWEGDTAGAVASGAPAAATPADWTTTGIEIDLTAGINAVTHRDLRSDGDSPCIPSGSWWGWLFEGTVTGLTQLCISMRCREVAV